MQGTCAPQLTQLAYPTCAACGIDLRRPFLCLSCAHAACLFRDPVRDASLPVTRGAAQAAADGAEEGSSHIGLHLAEEAHPYACDIVHGTLFCSACDDVVYDPRFEYVWQCETRRSRVPSIKEHALDQLGMNDARTPHSESLPCVCRMPRGLRNMGATCFLNVILQAFLHNPLLRNYFLSDRHNAALCSLGRDCLACEMDKLYKEFFGASDTQGPYGPTSFLFAIWMDVSSAELSQAGQHDAHEMFISALNGIHNALTAHALERTKLPPCPWTDDRHLELLSEHADDHTPVPKPAVDHVAMCPCVIHRTFCGILQSSVTCQSCQLTTHTHEPFLDVSLQVHAPGDTDESKKKRHDPKKQKQSIEAPAQTLHASLLRYCAPEQLPEASYRCSHCQKSARATKQLRLFQLPPVLCIQLKRYEHGLSATKVDTRVQFPFVLDVHECCAHTAREDESLDPYAYAYDLFTVVVHEGTLTSGHYTNYSKWRGLWYRYDDDKVTRVSTHQVLEARAYQLFYLRRRLWNQPGHGIYTNS